EVHPSVHHCQRALGGGGNSEAAGHERDRRTRLNLDQPAAIRALEALLPPETHLQRGGAGKAGAFQTEVSEEALDGDSLAFELERHGLNLARQVPDPQHTVRASPGVARL